MPIPNAIIRTLDLAHPQAKVWAALATLDGITAWFGSQAEGDMRPATIRMRWDRTTVWRRPSRSRSSTRCPSSLHLDDQRRPGRRPAADLRRVRPRADGFRYASHGHRERLRSAPGRVAGDRYQGNTEGWRSELDKLVAFLDAA